MKNTNNALAMRKSKAKKPKHIFQKLIILALAIYFIAIVIVQQAELSRANSVIAEYNEKILTETDTRARLQSELAEVNTEEYLIQKTREKLGLVRSNERVFVDMSKSGSN